MTVGTGGAAERDAHPSPLTAVTLAVALLTGLFLAILPLVTRQPQKAAAAVELFDAMRPQTTEAAVAEGRADLATMRGMASAMTQQALPQIASRLRQTPLQFGTEMAQNYPATARTMIEMSSMLDFFGRYQQTFEVHAATVRGLGDPPFPAWLVPLALGVLPGVVAAAAAAAGLLRPRRARRAALMVLATGAVLVAVLLATDLHGQEATADQLTTAFTPVYSQQGLDRADAYASDLQAMTAELQQRLLPDFAARLDSTPQQLIASLSGDSPVLAAGLQQLPRMVARLVSATRDNRAHATQFQDAASIPWSGASKVTGYWLTVVPALVLVLAGAGAAADAAGRRRRPPLRR